VYLLYPLITIGRNLVWAKQAGEISHEGTPVETIRRRNMPLVKKPIHVEPFRLAMVVWGSSLIKGCSFVIR
jgi:hypothetical protein